MLLLLLASLTFVKSFPGSSPDYYRIVLQEDGAAVYFTEEKDPRPIAFKVSEDLTKQAFDLAAKLDHFKGASLESPRKVAFMGKKTAIWESGSERGETSFNYSDRPEANDLTTLFERISATQQTILELQRIMRFDKLGLMKYLLQTEIALDKKDLADPEQLVGLLEQISNNKTFMDICRQRAKIMISKIQNPPK
jgi:hypothetical protein